MSISYWLDQSSLNTVKCDYVIVGAGIAGLSTAYWLEKKAPRAKIMIIDRNGMGEGASGRNAGFVTCGSALHFRKLTEQFGLEKAAEIWRFSETNRELLLAEIIQEAAGTVDYFNSGSATVIPHSRDLEKFMSILSDMKSVGIDADFVDAQNLKARYAVKNSAGAVEYHHDGVIHPIKLLKKLRARLSNTEIRTGEEVHRIDHRELRTQNSVFKFDQLFVCTNGFLGELLPEFEELIRPQRGQIILTAPVEPLIKGPCYLVEHLCYFRQLPAGEILVGGFRNHDVEAENTSHDLVTDQIQLVLEDFVKTYFQTSVTPKVQYRWSGIMGFSTDGQMLLGSSARNKFLHVMAGCSGHGMGLSFHAAQKLVNHAFGEALPDFLDLGRFQRPS